MILRYTVLDTLPPMAWLAEIRGGQAEVLCGGAVERNASFFAAGAWDAPYSEGALDTAEWFCGTGARLTPEGIVFSTPTHVINGLYYMPAGDGWRFSNSLCFLLARSGEALDPQYAGYERDFNTILDGVLRYREDVRVLGGSEIKVCYFRTLSVSDGGELTVSVKPRVRAFRDFADYRARLFGAMARFAENAADPARAQPLGMVTTVSKGYDAPCCAAVARHSGCDTAVTFTADGKYASDSGVEIARALGYPHIIERDSLAYRRRTDLLEAEFLASGELGPQVSFAAFDEDFRGKLVFMGARGDSVWGLDEPCCNDDFHFDGRLSHLGHSEHMLWAGYVIVPMPLYGATAWTSLQAVSRSAEMAPWSLKNDYDRPIPRRILEESGVARELFGMDKHGAGFSYRYDWMKRILSKMSPDSGASFTAYVQTHAHYRLADTLRYFWKTRGVYLQRLGLPVRVPPKEVLVKTVNPTAVRYLIPWASEVITERYKTILENKH